MGPVLVVQPQGINNDLRQPLSALVELQQSIATDECDVDGAVHLISERARDVANATGIAIGLLKGDQLVYRAGSGSAVAYLGRHVMATLSVLRTTRRAARFCVSRILRPTRGLKRQFAGNSEPTLS